jgi:hypothetical protein
MEGVEQRVIAIPDHYCAQCELAFKTPVNGGAHHDIERHALWLRHRWGPKTHLSSILSFRYCFCSAFVRLGPLRGGVSRTECKTSIFLAYV